MYATLSAAREKIRNKRVTMWVDNIAVVHNFNGSGGKDVRCSRWIKRIVELAHSLNVKITMKWVNTTCQKADEVSRRAPLTEARLRPEIGKIISEVLQPTVDLFASETNRLNGSIDFVSEFPCDGALAVDGLSYKPLPGDFIYMFPPKTLRLPAVRSILPVSIIFQI